VKWIESRSEKFDENMMTGNGMQWNKKAHLREETRCKNIKDLHGKLLIED
jgi:hypothetical protein